MYLAGSAPLLCIRTRQSERKGSAVDILGAVVHAVSLGRGGARLTGHHVPGLEDVHGALTPVRARQNSEQAQEIGQSFSGTDQQDAGTDAEVGDAAPDIGGSDIGTSDVAESGGVLEFLGDAVDWIADLF